MNKIIRARHCCLRSPYSTALDEATIFSTPQVFLRIGEDPSPNFIDSCNRRGIFAGSHSSSASSVRREGTNALVQMLVTSILMSKTLT